MKPNTVNFSYANLDFEATYSAEWHDADDCPSTTRPRSGWIIDVEEINASPAHILSDLKHGTLRDEDGELISYAQIEKAAEDAALEKEHSKQADYEARTNEEE